MAQVRQNIIEVVRTRSNEFGTFGRLFLNDEFQCYTLEPAPSATLPIPEGSYPLTLNVVSPKYRFRMPYLKHKGRVPRLLNVPGHKGILIHIGNFLRDTSGCILVGQRASLSRLYNSTIAYNSLYSNLIKLNGDFEVVISSLKVKGFQN